MKITMRCAPGCGLAAPQIGLSLQLVVIEYDNLSHLTAKQIAERDLSLVPFHVIVNPKTYVEEDEKVEFFEGCLSMSQYGAVVPRFKSVRVEYLNERAEPVVIYAKGWYAHILQHEIDHLNGALYFDKACLSTFMTQKNYMKLWKDRSVKDIHAELSSKKN